MNVHVCLAAVVLTLAAPPTEALYEVVNRGIWPEDWPASMEPLREQSRTLVGPIPQQHHYAITFTSREEFEAAWPVLVGLKTKGTPITLRRGNFWLSDSAAGVCIHSPSADQAVAMEVNPDEPFRFYRENAISIELIVDGEIVDLNRIELPPDTNILDRRFDKTAAGQQ